MLVLDQKQVPSVLRDNPGSSLSQTVPTCITITNLSTPQQGLDRGRTNVPTDRTIDLEEIPQARNVLMTSEGVHTKPNNNPSTPQQGLYTGRMNVPTDRTINSEEIPQIRNVLTTAESVHTNPNNSNDWLPPLRPNTSPLFDVIGTRPLLDSPSPLVLNTWQSALIRYPDDGTLSKIITGIIANGVRVGYEGPLQNLQATNLPTTALDPQSITSQVASDLAYNRIRILSDPQHQIFSPLGLAAKHNGGYRRIHHLSFPRRAGITKGSVNAFIPEEYSSLRYTRLDEIWRSMISAGRGSIIFKRDIKSAFRNVALATEDHWLFGFHWNGVAYTEQCLPFGLATAPMLFNLLAEALH